jgi:chemotaxis signal transduction protein
VTDPAEIPALVFRVAGVTCALPSSFVIETMRPLPTVPLDDMPPFTRGVATIRGTATPVVDLAALLGEPDAPPTRFVTIRVAGRTVALAVGDVVGLTHLGLAQLASRPPLLSNGVRPLVGSLAMKDDALHLVLDAARLVEHAEPSR